MTSSYTFIFPGYSLSQSNRALELVKNTVPSLKVTNQCRVCDLCSVRLPLTWKSMDCLSCYTSYDLCHACDSLLPRLKCPPGFGCSCATGFDIKIAKVNGS
jgi:hypothetical protein